MEQVMYWNKKLETMPRKERESLQLERFRERMAYVYDRSPMYKKNMIRQESNHPILKHCQIFPGYRLRSRKNCWKARKESRHGAI